MCVLLRYRLNGRLWETRERSRGIQVPLRWLAGLRDTFSVLGDISGMVIEISWDPTDMLI